ncbi:MAG: class I SAM-dependent methyltransferase [Chlorobi bacterium]|nr:class I SAM-dependent methyltransferase [Chlorobiota bacterium]
MYDFHQDKKRYYEIQYKNARHSILPFVQPFLDLNRECQVMEIGSAEGGNLKPFAEAGCTCTGIELSAPRIQLAEEFASTLVKKGKIRFIHSDIHNINPADHPEMRFDLIFLKDVLEHIHNQEKMIRALKAFLKPGGIIFFGFPSWYMPFGGHQQMCHSRFLSRLPWIHLLPMPAYKTILRWINRHPRQNEGLIEIKKTGITIRRFERICRSEKLIILKKQFYLVPPIYIYKFNIKTRKLPAIIGKIPLLREFFTTSAYYVISNE